MILGFLIIGLVYLVCFPVSAASIGSPETQGKGEFALGVESEVVFDRDFEKIDNLYPEIDKMYRGYSKLSYGIFDNWDIYVKLGIVDPLIKVNSFEFDGRNSFLYGGGTKITYDLCNDWLIGTDLQYLTHKNKYCVGKMRFEEWHVAPYIARKINNFTPYLGVKYSDMRVKIKNPAGKTNLKAKDNFGVFAGADYKINEDMLLNLEGRFIDETAMSIAFTYKF